MAIINIEKLNYSYGRKEVLKELSLDIDENKVINRNNRSKWLWKINIG